jgi:hypothetical protein
MLQLRSDEKINNPITVHIMGIEGIRKLTYGRGRIKLQRSYRATGVENPDNNHELRTSKKPILLSNSSWLKIKN